MPTYSYGEPEVELLKKAADHFESEMGDFEERKQLLLGQRTMDINTQDVKDKICAIKDRIQSCTLEGNDVVAAKVIVEYYIQSIERTDL